MKDADILADRREFMGRWLSIENKARKGSVIPFNRPSQEQKTVLPAFLDPKVKLIVINKARQIYMSTLAAGNCFHEHASARGPLRTMVATDHNDTNRSLMRKYKTFSDHLPGRISRQLRVRINNNQNEVHFPRGGGVIKLATAGGSSLGKSQTYQHMIAEEMAFWRNAEEAWASIKAAVSDEGRKVIISTPNGPGNLFHDQVEKAYKADHIDKDPSVKFFFFPWYEHHEYRTPPPPGWEPTSEEARYAETYSLYDDQLYWRHRQVWGPEGIGLDKFRKFFPTTMEEGFLHFDGSWFDVGYLNELIGVHASNRQRGNLRIYRKPQADRAYAIGVDPSLCTGGHYAVAYILDETGRTAAVYSTKTGGTKAFAQRVSRLAGVYNDARVLVESNPGGGGQTVLDLLREEGVSLWIDADTGKDWWTSQSSKERAYEHARQMLNSYSIDCPDLPTLRELTRIREVRGRIANHNTGKGDEAMDDHADAYVLAEYNRRSLPRHNQAESRRHRPRHSKATNPHADLREVLT
tara:strand:+ start:4420 stop:5985 length:1566 start_codon:yes stop_codon:yes gene_type:complete